MDYYLPLDAAIHSSFSMFHWKILKVLVEYLSYGINQESRFKSLHILLFFYIHKNKALDSQKFSISGFWWIYIFWDVLNMIWSFLENVWLSLRPSVCLYYFVETVSQELMGGNWWNLIFSCTFMGLRAD